MKDLNLDVSYHSPKSFNLYITLNESPDILKQAYLEEKKRALPIIQKKRQLSKTLVPLQTKPFSYCNETMQKNS